MFSFSPEEKRVVPDAIRNAKAAPDEYTHSFLAHVMSRPTHSKDWRIEECEEGSEKALLQAKLRLYILRCIPISSTLRFSQNDADMDSDIVEIFVDALLAEL